MYVRAVLLYMSYIRLRYYTAILYSVKQVCKRYNFNGFLHLIYKINCFLSWLLNSS